MNPGEEQDMLEQLETRLQREIADMLGVLRVDIPNHVVRTLRTVFEESARSDGLSDRQLKAFKEDTVATSQRVAAEVCQELEPWEVWGWERDWAFPAEPRGLKDHPRVCGVLDGVSSAVEAVLERHGFSPSELGESRGAYVLPAYFVAGSFMKSLVANYWRVLRDYDELKQRLDRESRTDERETRRARWDRA